MLLLQGYFANIHDFLSIMFLNHLFTALLLTVVKPMIRNRKRECFGKAESMSHKD